jgi:hypothetical protein
MIIESNKDIELLVQYLNSKIIEFRNLHPNSQTLLVTKKFYDEIIIPWMEEFQLTHQEVDQEYDEEMKNKILDLINFLNKIP